MGYIYIPRIPTTNKVKYFTSIPDILRNRISSKEWVETINDINSIIEISSKMSLLRFFANFLIFPIIFTRKTSLDRDLYKYLKSRNLKLAKYGIYLCHPVGSSYNEIKIIINENGLHFNMDLI